MPLLWTSIIQNMQNNTQHNFLTTQWLIHSQSPSSNRRSWKSQILWILQNFPPKKGQTHWKVWTPWTKEHSNLKKKKKQRWFLSPSQPPFINSACHLWYGIFPLASWVQLSGCVPSHSCTPAHWLNMGLEDILEIPATTKNISIINVLLVLNPKHSSYSEENYLYPSWNQDNILNQESKTEWRMWVDTLTSLSMHEHKTSPIDTAEAKTLTSNKHFWHLAFQCICGLFLKINIYSN